MVDLIPAPPRPEQEEREGKELEADPRQATGDSIDCQDVEKEQTTEESHNPFSWLAGPLLEACMLGLDDAIVKLLSVGAVNSLPKDTDSLTNSPLHEAVAYSHVNPMKTLLEAGTNVDSTDTSGRTPLYRANSATAVRALLVNGATIDFVEANDQLMPIQLMAKVGNFTALEAVLSHKDHREYFEEGASNHPVNLAAKFGRRKCLEILLRYGFSPNIADTEMQTPLLHAVKTGRVDICRTLLEHRADPNLTPDESIPPLHQAIMEDRSDILKLLVEHKADIERRETHQEGWSRTPLQVAINWNRMEHIEYLLGQGANPNVHDSDDQWALFVAARSGWDDVVQKLADAKADLNTLSDQEKWTPLHGAYPHPGTVSLLIDLGADLSITTLSDYTPLDIALVNGSKATVETILEKSKTKFDFSLRGAQKAIVGAVESNYHEAVGAILEAGADVNTVDVDYEDNKNEPLTGTAMRLGEAYMMRKLLEFRPDLDLVSEKQNTALHCITDETPVESVRLFVNAGGRLDALNKDRETPLSIAADSENDAVFEYIIGKEVARSVLHVTPREQVGTVMHIACFKGRLQMVRLLIEQKFDVNLVSDGIWGTPLLSAAIGPERDEDREEKKEIVELLLKEGADPHKAGGYFGYPINVACLSTYVDVVQIFLNLGVSVDVRDPLGRKPAHMACYNSLQVLNLLQIPDSDFAERDVVGRVPLHYAACSGQPDLVQEVLARSMRVGVDVDVADHDGWTPLLWATRCSASWRRPHKPDLTATDVVSMLLDKGANPKIKGLGFSSPFSASQIAYYHHADGIGDLICQKIGEQPPQTKRRGRQAPDLVCECCQLEIVGSYSQCDDCYNWGVCFKCTRSTLAFHPRHSLINKGEEWDDDGNSGSEKSVSVDEATQEEEEEEEEAEEGDDEDGDDPAKPADASSAGFDDEIVG
ncbi:hypothetical protein F66182_7918 [Fusarium sp. NRRL 66182]|nr:hypothetical protein F66182_7918 [Fusarium sp. NRRL 66182]